jgi:hypothetical protein
MLLLCIAALGLSGCVAQLDYNYRAMQKNGYWTARSVEVTDAPAAELLALNQTAADMARVSQ